MACIIPWRASGLSCARLPTVLGAQGPAAPAASLGDLVRTLYRDGPRQGVLYDAEPYYRCPRGQQPPPPVTAAG
jgi:hypothetical protein